MSATPSANLSSLEQKLAANPAAKIFLPLAEQYRRHGNLERAAETLQAGLVHNPGYSAARVALGRVMLEQGQVTQGRLLLTALIADVPDNLLAQKLLADAGGPLLAEDVEESEAPEATAEDASDVEAGAAADPVAEAMDDAEAIDTAEGMADAGPNTGSRADAEAAGKDAEAADDEMKESASLAAGGDEIEASPSLEPQEAHAEDGVEAPDPEDETHEVDGPASGDLALMDDGGQEDSSPQVEISSPDDEDGRSDLQVPDAEELSFDVSEALDDEDGEDSVQVTAQVEEHDGGAEVAVQAEEVESGVTDAVPDEMAALGISGMEDTLSASDQPDEVEEPEQSAELAASEQPDEVEEPEQSAELAASEQPDEVEEPEQSAELAASDQPDEVEEPEQSTDLAEPEQVTALEESQQPTELEEHELVAVAQDVEPSVAMADVDTFEEGLTPDAREDEVTAAPEPVASAEYPGEMTATDEEVVWANPDGELPEPPAPEPGTWKADDESAGPQEVGHGEDSPPAGISSWDTPDSEFVVSETTDQTAGEALGPDAAGATEVTMESAEIPGPEPFETVRLKRDDLLPALSESSAAETEVATVSPLSEAEQGPADEVSALSETDEEAEQAATVMEAVVVSPEEEAVAERTLNLARLYRRQGRLDLASDVYRQVLVADPDDMAARRELEELCGQNVPEITDDDLVSQAAVFPGGVPVASTESLEDARQRKVMFLRAWLEHIRQQS